MKLITQSNPREPIELIIRLDSCYEVNRIGLELAYATEIEVTVEKEGSDLATACHTESKFTDGGI